LSSSGAARDAVFAAHRGGRLREAEAGYLELLRLDPHDDAARHGLALALLQGAREREALPLLQMLLERAFPRSEELYALACRRLGEIARGLAVIEPLLQRERNNATAWCVGGSLRVLAGDAVGGEAALRRALALQPGVPDGVHFLAVALHRQQRWAEAIEQYRRALATAPTDAALRYNLALCLEQLGELDAAQREYDAVVLARPARVDAWARRANLQALRCDFEGEAQSVVALDALLLDPQRLADDDQVEPFALTFLPLGESARRTALRRYVDKVRRGVASLPAPPRAAFAAQATPLRLGYLSPDFGEHAVGGLVRDLFAAHDRNLVEVYAYSLRRHHGAVADAIRAGCDAFHELERESNQAIAARIAADRIQVLIDLGGYTLGARPEIAALRPAPVQLGWLGFIHDYAAEWIDAVLLDPELAAVAGSFETAVRLLPGCALPAAHAEVAPARASRAEFGLPERGVLFASFNNSYKLDAELIGAWSEISRRVPDASFVVYVPDAARAGLQRAWSQAGARAGALHLVPRLPLERHRARAGACDLFLDAFRYQAGATAVAAIEAGLPLLCRAGSTPLARLSLSMNRHLGLERLVCADTTGYVERACALAANPSELDALRAELAVRVRTTGLLAPQRSARAIEAGALASWSEYCRGLRPEHGLSAQE
jgi:protein O-GlcNAc transferase